MAQVACGGVTAARRQRASNRIRYRNHKNNSFYIPPTIAYNLILGLINSGLIMYPDADRDAVTPSEIHNQARDFREAGGRGRHMDPCAPLIRRAALPST